NFESSFFSFALKILKKPKVFQWPSSIFLVFYEHTHNAADLLSCGGSRFGYEISSLSTFGLGNAISTANATV
ncbi:hypothetical protein, partial [Bacillus cereus]|uniref:hypothetical protein n=1 Tax=Bacillus cereus TaxID=1396 RepID=UPI001C54EB06